MAPNLEVRRVLIIEDEPDLRGILQRLVQDLNLECGVAENGQVGLHMLKSHVYHAVLCDIMMPQMSGLECLAGAQAEGLLTPFVFVTGYSDPKLMLQAIRLGATDFIGKPFAREEVADVLFRVLEMGVRRKRLHDEVQLDSPMLAAKLRQGEKSISMLRVHNNRKRTA